MYVGKQEDRERSFARLFCNGENQEGFLHNYLENNVDFFVFVCYNEKKMGGDFL